MQRAPGANRGSVCDNTSALLHPTLAFPLPCASLYTPTFPLPTEDLILSMVSLLFCPPEALKYLGSQESLVRLEIPAPSVPQALPGSCCILTTD